jgi:uncharacterized protein involved in outer membrane biogenesis
MKKLLYLVGGLALALIVAVVSVPLFVDVDRYRTQISDQVNQRINGQLTLGKLKLSLWGAIKINAEKVRLDVAGFTTPAVDASEFHLEIPYLSLLSGRPQVVAVLRQPKIFVEKRADGQMNLMHLMKPKGTALLESASSEFVAARSQDELSVVSSAAQRDPKSSNKQPPAAPTEAPSGATAAAAKPTSDLSGSIPNAAGTAVSSAKAESKPSELPSILKDARLGLRIEEGSLVYQDLGSKANYSVNGLQLEARDVGLGSPMQIEALAPMVGEMAAGRFSGPIRLNAQLQPILVGSEVRSAQGRIELDATELEFFHTSNAFIKPKGMVLTVRTMLEGDESETRLKGAELLFHRLKLNAKGRVVAHPLRTQMELGSDPIPLNSLKDFLPPLAEYELEGNSVVTLNVDFTPNQLKYNGDFRVTGGRANAPKYLRGAVSMDMQSSFSENTFQLIKATLAGPGSDLQITGDVRNFLAPQFRFTLAGKSLDLDQMLILPKGKSPEEKKTSLNLWLLSPPKAWAETAANPLISVVNNEIFRGASGTVTAQINRFRAYETTLEQLQAKLNLTGRVLKLQESSFLTFGGLIKSTGEVDLRTPLAPFRTLGTVEGIQAKAALANYFPKYANTLEGSVKADWNLSGAAFPALARVRSIKGNAKMVASDGSLKSVDFQETINSAMKQVPFLKEKKPIVLDDGFKTLEAKLEFQGGVIRAEPIEVQPKGKGFVIKGKSTIQENLEQESFFDVFDPQGILPKEIQQAGKPTLAVRLYGPVTAPKTDYSYTVKRVASNAGKNAVRNLLDKAVGGGQEGGSGDAIKDAADKLRKKFKLF